MTSLAPRNKTAIKENLDQESVNLVRDLLALRRVAGKELNSSSTVVVVTTTQTQSISVTSCPPASRKTEAGAENEDEERRRVMESLKQSLAAAAQAQKLPSITEQEIEMARCISLMAARAGTPSSQTGQMHSSTPSPGQRPMPSNDVGREDSSDRDETGGRGKWTKEEDDRLHTAVKELGDSQWKTVADRVGTRSASQCLHRWKYSLQPCISRNKWSADEDAKLVQAVRKYGSHWSLIAQMMGTRTGAQCRERYCNKLDPQIYRGHWTVQEDQHLLNVVKETGIGRWAHVSKMLNPPRTDYQVRKRWYLLQRRMGLTPGDSVTDGSPSTPHRRPSTGGARGRKRRETSSEDTSSFTDSPVLAPRRSSRAGGNDDVPPRPTLISPLILSRPAMTESAPATAGDAAGTGALSTATTPHESGSVPTTPSGRPKRNRRPPSQYATAFDVADEEWSARKRAAFSKPVQDDEDQQ